MSGQIAGVSFVAATAALALWAAVRWPWRPPTLGAALVHAALALAALQVAFFLVENDDPPWWRFTGLLTVVGPAFVYTWLSWAWFVLFWKTADESGPR